MLAATWRTTIFRSRLLLTNQTLSDLLSAPRGLGFTPLRACLLSVSSATFSSALHHQSIEARDKPPQYHRLVLSLTYRAESRKVKIRKRKLSLANYRDSQEKLLRTPHVLYQVQLSMTCASHYQHTHSMAMASDSYCTRCSNPECRRIRGFRECKEISRSD
jgi:hypothetical protein